MKFRFIGDPAHNFDGPDAFEKFGHHFSRSEWTDVADEWVIAKLRGNAHFEAEAVAPTHPAHADDERRAFLISEAEALGIDVDRRWGNATLERKISEVMMAKA